MINTDRKLNGFNLEAIDNTLDQVKGDPKIAEFKFRAVNKWETGVKNQTIIHGFYGGKKEDESRADPFIINTDMPEVLNGANTAPNPPEFLLHSLASCLTTSMMLLATARGLSVEGVAVSVEGAIDLNGFLGTDSCVIEEYQNISVLIDVEGPFTKDEKEELLKLAKRSPVYKSIINPVPVDISIKA